MIAYLDTSALIPLIVEEPASERAGRMWDEAERVVTVRVAYPEGRAALARARRLGRLTQRRYRSARDGFEDLWTQLDRVELTAALARRAGDLTDQLGVRATTPSTSPPPKPSPTPTWWSSPATADCATPPRPSTWPSPEPESHPPLASEPTVDATGSAQAG